MEQKKLLGARAKELAWNRSFTPQKHLKISLSSTKPELQQGEKNSNYWILLGRGPNTAFNFAKGEEDYCRQDTKNISAPIMRHPQP